MPQRRNPIRRPSSGAGDRRGQYPAEWLIDHPIPPDDVSFPRPPTTIPDGNGNGNGNGDDNGDNTGPVDTADPRKYIKEEYIVWDNPKVVAQWVEQAYRSSKKRKREFERRAAHQILNYVGKQYFDWDEEAGAFTPVIEELVYRVRLVINLTKGYVKDFANRLGSAKPDWEVIPRSSHQSSQDKAYVAGRLLHWNWRQLRMSKKMSRLFVHMACTGGGYIKSYWDDKAGGMFKVPEDEDGIVEALLEGESDVGIDRVDDLFDSSISQFAEDVGAAPAEKQPKGKITLDEGAPGSEVRTVFEISHDPHGDDIDTSQWVIDTHRRSISYIRMKYPHFPWWKLTPGLEDDDENPLFPRVLDDTQDGILTRGLSVDDEEEGSDGTFLVHELWHRPTIGYSWQEGGELAEYPNGIYGVFCQLMSLQPPTDNPHDSKHLQLPYVHAIADFLPGEYEGGTPASDSLYLQAQLNRLESSKIEAINLTADPVMVVDRNAVDWEMYTGEPASRIEKRPNSDVRYLIPPTYPQFAVQMPETIRQYLNSIWGDHDFSQGKAETEARSGRAIRLLQEANNQRFAATREDLEDIMAEFGAQQLSLMGQYMDDESMFSVVGKDGYRQWLRFIKSDFSDDELAFDVQPRMFSRAGHSPLAVREDTEVLTRLGYLRPDDPVDRQLVRQKWGYGGGVDDWDARSRGHRALAMNENELLHSGNAMPKPKPRQDHASHTKVHDDFRDNSREFGELDKEQREALENHVIQHQFQLAIDVARPKAFLERAMAALGQDPFGTGEGGPQPGKPPGRPNERSLTAPQRRDRPERRIQPAGGAPSSPISTGPQLLGDQ